MSTLKEARNLSGLRVKENSSLTSVCETIIFNQNNHMPQASNSITPNFYNSSFKSKKGCYNQHCSSLVKGGLLENAKK